MSENDRKLYIAKLSKTITRELGYCRNEVKFLHDECGLPSEDESQICNCMETILSVLKNFESAN